MEPVALVYGRLWKLGRIADAVKWPVEQLVEAAGESLEELLEFQDELDRLEAAEMKVEAEKRKRGNGS